MNVERPRAELAPIPRKGRAHWGRVHVEADRRRPFARPFKPKDLSAHV